MFMVLCEFNFLVRVTHPAFVDLALTLRFEAGGQRLLNGGFSLQLCERR